MSEIIMKDVNALIETFKREQALNPYDRLFYDKVIAIIENAPTVEQPTDEWCTDCKEYDHKKNCCPRFNKVIRETLKDEHPTGEWIDKHYDLGHCSAKCSHCGKRAGGIAKDTGFGYKYLFYKYCPNCGAKMRNGG